MKLGNLPSRGMPFRRCWKAGEAMNESTADQR